MKTKLDKNKHSVYLLYFHLVLVVKYRRKAIDDEISGFLKSAFSRLGESQGIILEEWKHDYDHVHMMFRSVPNVDLSKNIMSYKSVSSRFVKQRLWKDAFWSRSYCLLTTGGAPIETIRKYIQSQRQE